MGDRSDLIDSRTSGFLSSDYRCSIGGKEVIINVNFPLHF